MKVEVEIWPTSMVFKKGHRIRLDVQPRDGLGSSHYMHYHADYNSGATNTVYAGGDMDVVSAAACHTRLTANVGVIDNTREFGYIIQHGGGTAD